MSNSNKLRNEDPKQKSPKTEIFSNQFESMKNKGCGADQSKNALKFITSLAEDLGLSLHALIEDEVNCE